MYILHRSTISGGAAGSTFSKAAMALPSIPSQSVLQLAVYKNDGRRSLADGRLKYV